MVTVVLYDQKQIKIKNNDLIELDSIELETLSYSSHAHEFSEIPSSKIKDKTILEWFELKGESVWWLVSPVIYPRYDQAALFIDRMLMVLEKYRPDKIILKGMPDKKDLLEQICKKNKINLDFQIPIQVSIRHLLKNKSKKSRFKQLTDSKHKKRLQCYKRDFTIPEKDYILINAHQSYRRTFTDNQNHKKRLEFLIQPILDEFENKPHLCFDLDYTLKGTTKILQERLQTQYHWTPIEIILKQQKSKNFENNLKFLKNNISKLVKNIKNEPFTYRGFSLWSYVKPIFEEIFYEPYLPTFLHLIEKIDELFDVHPPKLIVQVYETGPYAKCFEFVAKRKNIKTIGIMHGIIYNGNPDYMHREILQNNKPLGNPIPDTTFVFGEYFKKVLTDNGHYPSKNISIVTNPNFVDVVNFLNSNDKQTLRKKLHLPDVKTILIPLTFRFDRSTHAKEKFTLDLIFEKLKGKENLLVLLRPRPGDIISENELQFYYPSKNFQISSGSLNEDIFVSDIVVTTYSTVGIDAAIFEKPVIFLRTSHTNPLSEIQEFMKNCDMAKICDTENLYKQILSIPKDSKWKINESKNRQYFMKMMFNYGCQTSIVTEILKLL